MGTMINRRRIMGSKDVATQLVKLVPNLFGITPANGGAYNLTNAAVVNFQFGKTYRILCFAKKPLSNNEAYNLYGYKTASNSPVVLVGKCNTQYTEIIYTHNIEDTYKYLGCYTNPSTKSWSTDYQIVVYVEEI